MRVRNSSKSSLAPTESGQWWDAEYLAGHQRPWGVDLVGDGDRAPLSRVAVLGGGDAAQRIVQLHRIGLDMIGRLGLGIAHQRLDVDELLECDAERGARGHAAGQEQG